MYDTNWRSWRDDVKARVNLVDVATTNLHTKVQRNGRAAVTLCPFHAEDSPSFQVYDDHYHCFGCGEHGDLFDFLEKALLLEPDEAIRRAAEMAGIDAPSSGYTSAHGVNGRQADGQRPNGNGAGPREHTTSRRRSLGMANIAHLVEAAHDAYTQARSPEAQAVRAYVAGRGLAAVADALRFGVIDDTVLPHIPVAKREGMRGRLVVPTLQDGPQAIWYKARYVGGLSDGEMKERNIPKYDGPGGTIPTAYNPSGFAAAARRKMLILTEGELDCAAVLAGFDDLDMPVMGLPGGLLPEGTAEQIAAVGVPVLLLMDNDAAGAGHAERVKTALESQGVRVYVAGPPVGYNDLNAALIGLSVDAFCTAILEHIEDAATAEAAAIASLHSDRAYVEVGRLDEIRARRERSHTAYPTGVAALDALLDGGYGEGLHILGGITGTGKTSLALAIARHNALAGRPVIYASYEQSRFELWGRITTAITGVPQRAQKRGVYLVGDAECATEEALRGHPAWPKVLATSDYLRIVEAGDALSRSDADWTLQTLAAAARAIADHHGAPPLLIIDYLQRVPVPTDLKIRDVRERVGYVAGALQVLTRSVGCPILALSSLSRAAYRLADSDLEGKLASLKEAGELEYTAHSAVVLYALPEAVQNDLKMRSITGTSKRPMALELVKQRDGGCGRVAVLWDPTRDAWDHSAPWK